MNERTLADAVRTGSPESIVELFHRLNDPVEPDGRRLLHHAVDCGYTAAIEALAAAGADLDVADNEGFSPLHYAAGDENYADFTALVERGANPGLPDGRGRTPLQLLSMPGRYPHDAIARFTFGYPVMARGLLRTILPAHMVPDDAVIRRIDGELVSHALSRTLRSDMILVLERRDRRPVVVVVEFQSGVDHRMAERMGCYRSELWQTIRKNHAELVGPTGRIPSIVTTVVHTGTQPWNATGDADDLADPPEEPELDFHHRPHVRYAVQDVHRTDYSRYRDNPAAAYFRLCRGDRADTLRAAEELDRLLPLDKYRPLRHLLMTTAALGARHFPEAALKGVPFMTGFAQHYDAAVERANASDARAAASDARADAFDARAKASDARAEASDARAEASDARAEGFRASSRELLADLAAERFDAEAGERLKAMLDSIVDPEQFQEATAHVRTSRTAQELFAYFDKRH